PGHLASHREVSRRVDPRQARRSESHRGGGPGAAQGTRRRVVGWRFEYLGCGDFRRHRPRPLFAPARKTGGPAPGTPASADDGQVVGLFEDIAPGRLVGRDDLAGKAARPLVVGDAPARVLHEEPLDVALAPAALPKDLAVLAGEDDQRLVEATHVGNAAA